MAVLDTLTGERQRLLDWKTAQLAVHEQNLKAATEHVATRKAAMAAEADRLEKWFAERTASHQTNVKTVNDHVDREVAALDAQIAEQKKAADA